VMVLWTCLKTLPEYDKHSSLFGLYPPPGSKTASASDELPQPRQPINTDLGPVMLSSPTLNVLSSTFRAVTQHNTAGGIRHQMHILPSLPWALLLLLSLCADAFRDPRTHESFSWLPSLPSALCCCLFLSFIVVFPFIPSLFQTSSPCQ
jgi:hypothetical protein